MEGLINPTRLAREIVAGLFRNGGGQEAKRLVLELPDGRDGGGWAKKPAEDHIREIIERSMKQPKPKAVRTVRFGG